MATPLLRYSEAAEQVHRFLVALAAGGEIPALGSAPASHSSRPAAGNAATEMVPLGVAPGRVLAIGIHADRDQPPFPRSTRDGFACRAAEANTHQLLFLAGQIRAGQQPGKALQAGEMVEIMTGAPVPEGADCVVMQEYVEHSSNFVRQVAPRTIEPGENIVAQGAEARAGDLLLPVGVRLAAAQIALAAQCGCHEVAVYTRPRVAILSSGDELVAVDAVPGPGQIRNSNTPMLAALVSAAGAVPVLLATARDQAEALDAALAQALAPGSRIDLLLITGGISVGRFDLVEEALSRAGARFFFGGVAIQPGKPVAFGQLARPENGRATRAPLPFFALPGNPVSSAVTFQLFALPLLSALAEDTALQPRFALARLSGDWRGKAGLTRFLPAWCDFTLEPTVRLVAWQGSGDIAAFAASNCYLVVPDVAGELTEGALVRILLR